MYCSGESGVEKMKTCERSSMSMPRDATSVVTMWRISPALNFAVTFSRFFCGRSEDNIADGSPGQARKVYTGRVSSLVLQKIIEDAGFSYSMSLYSVASLCRRGVRQ